MPIHLNNKNGDFVYHRENTTPIDSVADPSSELRKPTKKTGSIPVWIVPGQEDKDEDTLSSKKFVWTYGGTDVRLTGPFDNWKGSIRMTPVNISNLNNNIFHVIVKGLDLSKDIPYKFVVDGNWCYDMRRAHVTESSGYINNIIYAET